MRRRLRIEFNRYKRISVKP